MPRGESPRHAEDPVSSSDAGQSSDRDEADDSLVAELSRRLVVAGDLEPWPDRAAIEASERYRVDDLLGEGGMARVYRAFDSVLGRPVALKLLRDVAPETVQRFLREARAQAKVEHEGVCHIYEVGELAGRPFIAMQYVAGATLRDVGPKLSLRAKVSVIRNVALAVHAAHRIGLVHRDLKPTNILLEDPDATDPRTYVVDFGIARDLTDTGGNTLGQALGTPRYMSPEQALGRPEDLDRRSDVYSLGVTLYELLAGVPPHTATTVTEILLKVAAEEPPPLRRHAADIAVDLETIVMTCLRRDPQDRYDSARALAEDLQRFLDGEPVHARRTSVWAEARARLRKHRALVAVIVVGVVGTSSAAIGMRVAANRERAARAAGLVDQAERSLADARGRRAVEESQRSRAFALFDDGREPEAEAAWSQALETRRAVELAYDQAGRALEAALAWDPDRTRARDRFAHHLFDRAVYSELRDDRARRDDLIERLAVYDDAGTYQRRWQAPATVAIASDPAGAQVWVSRVEADGRGTLVEVDARRLGVTPLARLELAPGSYVFRFEAPGRAAVRDPVLVARGESLELSVRLPAADHVPDGFIDVPAGRFLEGESGEVSRRLLLAPPLHERRTGEYLIGRTQVTIGDWLAFLDALPADERARRTPGAATYDRGSVSLEAIGPGIWEFRFRPVGAAHTYVARTGEPLRYDERALRAVQDWTRFPVIGISEDDAEAYAAWLDHTGKLPGARPCTRTERERAARGADAREYPQGRPPDPGEVNIKQSYGGAGIGLDEVGSHPASRSPLGVDDLIGEASDWTVQGTSVGLCGTAYSQSLWARSRVNALSPAPRDFRSPGVGMRLCASVAAP